MQPLPQYTVHRTLDLVDMGALDMEMVDMDTVDMDMVDNVHWTWTLWWTMWLLIKDQNQGSGSRIRIKP